MHSSKHDLLTYAVAAKLHEAAVAAGVSVDDLVTAGLRRHGAKPEAAAVVATLDPSLFDGLGAWPFTCGTCHAEVERLSRCPHCRVFGCASCAPGRGCAKCVAERERKAAASRDQGNRARG